MNRLCGAQDIGHGGGYAGRNQLWSSPHRGSYVTLTPIYSNTDVAGRV